MTMVFLAVLGLAVAHSAANPVHYLPFVALGKARGWGLMPTVLAAALASTGHLAGFAAAMLAGFAAGRGIEYAESLLHEGSRAGLILFLAFGAAYTCYGIVRGLKRKPCADSCNACPECGHGHERILRKADPQSPKYMMLLFLMFAVGPCDAILALVAYYAAEYSIAEIAVLGVAYYAATALTMAACTTLLYRGLGLFNFGGKFIDRWAHAISGLAITASAIAAIFLSHTHTH